MSDTVADTIQSPCIDVCELDDNNVCIGCFRHSDEIMAWPTLDAQGKRTVLGRIAERRKAPQGGC